MNSLDYRAMLTDARLSIADKSAIEAAYLEMFGRKINAKTSCRQCYNDALIEMMAYEKQGAQLRAGVVVKYNGHIYTRHSKNLPQAVIDRYRDKLIKS